MSITLTLPDDLVKTLENRATLNHVSLDEVIIELLTSALEAETAQLPTPEEVVAQIKALPPNPASIRPASGSLAEALQTGPVDPDFDLETWQKQWAAAEAEMKRLTQASDIAEGRS